MSGQAMYVDWNTSNFTVADLQDEVKVLSRYVDLIVARLRRHADLITMRRHSEVPIINGLTDFDHPCQALADFMTLKEHFGRGIFKKCVNSQAVYPLSEQHGLEAQERR